MRAVIYARFSSEKQHEASIEGQLRECLEYAKYNGMDIVEEYIDRAFSAKTDNRPDFQRMIKDSYKNTFDTVLVWKLDRFARNRYDSAYYKNILKKNGIRVISVKESISQGADGILLESILEGYAEYYSAELSEKVRRGMTENALKAKANGVHPPFGYYVDEDDKYQIDPNKECIVKEIFMRFVEGEKLTYIQHSLNRKGVENKGKPLTYNALYRTLTNRKYIGEYKFGDVVIPNAIPAIIDEDLFERAQLRLKQNKKAPAASRGTEEYILTTKLFCGKCGAMMTGEKGTSHTSKGYHYYKCYHARKKKCDKKTIRRDLIEDLVIQKIIELIMNDEIMDDLVERIYKMQEEKMPETLIIESQISDIEKRINNLIAAMEQGIFTSSTKKALEDLEEQKKNLELEQVKEEIKNPVFTQEQIRCVLYNYRTLDLTKVEGRKKLVDSFVNSIYLFDDHFVITFNYKNHSKTVTLEEVESSCLTSLGQPFIDIYANNKCINVYFFVFLYKIISFF